MLGLETAVRRSLRRAGYSGTHTLLLVAVSGGPDSMALLHCLTGLRAELNLVLHVGHVNHNFRGKESEEDATFVEEAASKLNIPSTIGMADPEAHQKQYGISSFEEAAREVRYDFLATVARRQQAKAIALGHTIDDQAETLFMRILRGTSLHGLRGMQEIISWRSPRGGVRGVLFRPFLRVTRRDILKYCREHHIMFREDTSNTSPDFTRNRLRQQLFPVLETYNPKVKDSLLRLGYSASQTQDYLDQETNGIWPTVSKKVGNTVVLDITKLKTLHPIIQHLIMRHAYREVAGDLRQLTRSHITQMAGMVYNTNGSRIDLPRGIKLYRSGQQLTLGANPVETCPFPHLFGEHPLNMPGLTRIPGWIIMSETTPPSTQFVTVDPLISFFDMDRIGQRLYVRTRVNGDRFRPLGMLTQKKLQDFYVDQKVSRSWRDRIPLLISEGGILWVVGYRPSESAKVRHDTRRMVKIQWRQTLKWEKGGSSL